MGNKNNKLLPLNEECPICLEKTSNNIILSCGHKYDYYCIQKHSYQYLIDSSNINCPYCRKKIETKELKLIFKEWMVLNYQPSYWKQYNTIDLNKTIKINKFNSIIFDNYIRSGVIFIPLVNYKPFFFNLTNYIWI